MLRASQKFDVKSCRFQIEPPWKPDLKSETDLKYISEDFISAPVSLTPTESALEPIEEEAAYFQSFSYQGSRSSLSSRLSNMSTT